MFSECVVLCLYSGYVQLQLCLADYLVYRNMCLYQLYFHVMTL